MNIPLITLNDGNKLPQTGLGLWKNSNSPEEFNLSFKAAIAAGYRHFDSAQAYGNEALLGLAVKNSGVKRSDLFLTTKISVENMVAHRTQTAFNDSLDKMQTDYTDLVLLHFPVSLARKKAWLALEQIQKEGRVRSIGVSNYTVKHLENMKKYASVTPAINQVELHVFLQQPELLEYCKKEGIVVEAYSPLAHARDMNEPLVTKIAKKHSKTYAQVMLRWCIQLGLVVLPKSVSPERIKENIDTYDFRLDEDDMQALASLNRNLRTCWDPTYIP